MKTLRWKIMLAIAIVIVAFSAALAAAEATVTDRYDDTFRKYSARFFGPGFDWRLFKAQAMAESNIDMNAKSWCGARGIMQRMPSTFAEVHSKNPEITAIDSPEWNIAAGIYYDSKLWNQWNALSEEADRRSFMLGSYNAGRGTLLRAQGIAQGRPLDPNLWLNIVTVAGDVPRWRHEETISYVRKIDVFGSRMDDRGHVVK